MITSRAELEHEREQDMTVRIDVSAVLLRCQMGAYT